MATQQQNIIDDPARDPKAIAEAKAQVAALKEMVAETAEARAERQRAKPLYERLGGREAIRAVMAEVVDLHFSEPITRPLMEGVDREKLLELVVQWMCSVSGGPQAYTGRDMVTAHAHLNMTDVHFMAAGDQIVRTLNKFGVPEPEQQEILAAIVAHHDDVIRD